MPLIQHLILTLLPKTWSAAMQAESERWMLQCKTCGNTRSLWEAGGVRYKGTARRKTTFVWCPQCRRLRWMTLELKSDPKGL